MPKRRRKRKRKLNPDGSPVPHRQNLWQQRQYELGNCIWCGQPRGDSPYKRWCRRHGALNRIRNRKALGTKPWRREITKGGQPPVDWQVTDRMDVDRFFPAKPPLHGKRRTIVKKEEETNERGTTQ